LEKDFQASNANGIHDPFPSFFDILTDPLAKGYFLFVFPCGSASIYLGRGKRKNEKKEEEEETQKGEIFLAQRISPPRSFQSKGKFTLLQKAATMFILSSGIRGAAFRQGFRVSTGDPGVSPDIVQEGTTPRMEKIPDYPVRVQVAPVRICNIRKGKAADTGRLFGELFKKLIDVAHRDSHNVVRTFNKG
jgi:hypothetical protein